MFDVWVCFVLGLGFFLVLISVVFVVFGWFWVFFA